MVFQQFILCSGEYPSCICSSGQPQRWQTQQFWCVLSALSNLLQITMTHWRTIQPVEQLLSLAAAWLAIILVTSDAACTSLSKCINKYNSTTKQFYRTYWGLTEVPPDIPTEALQVYLYGNEITYIPVGVFNQLSQCTLLWLSDNKISSIQDSAFNGMVSLRDIRLTNNAISSLKSEMFVGLNNLHSLNLGQNQIAEMDEGTFNRLKSLRILYLNNNHLSTIQQRTFHFLFYLNDIDLRGNRLTTMNPDVFSNLPRPLVLGLSQDPHTPGNTNQWNCRSLCWLKYEEHHETVTFHKLSDNSPICADNTAWSSLKCGEPGK